MIAHAKCAAPAHGPKYNVYEAYGTVNELPDPTMPLERDRWLDPNTAPLEYEHEPHPPIREYQHVQRHLPFKMVEPA